MAQRSRFLLVTAALLSVVSMSAQGPGVDRVMRKKLVCAQNILEAVVTSHWANLSARTVDLDTLTNDPAWRVLNGPEYVRYSAAFRSALRALHDAAERRDADETPTAYAAMTLSCVECHRYLARSRIAGR